MVIISLLLYTFVIFPDRLRKDFHGFPDEVAARLRLALWYTNDRHFNPEKALHHYKEALVLANKAEMDPFGDQYFGMRLKIAAFFEKINTIPKAIELLEHDRQQYIKAVEMLSAREGREERRAQVLFKTIALNAKLAEYYSHEQVQDDEAAEERLVWAVTALLKEQERRRSEGIKESIDNQWISDEQTGGTLEGKATIKSSTTISPNTTHSHGIDIVSTC